MIGLVRVRNGRANSHTDYAANDRCSRLVVMVIVIVHDDDAAAIGIDIDVAIDVVMYTTTAATDASRAASVATGAFVEAAGDLDYFSDRFLRDRLS